MAAKLDWGLTLNSSLGNVLPLGRWSYEAIALVAAAINGGEWDEVEDFARTVPWDDTAAC